MTDINQVLLTILLILCSILVIFLIVIAIRLLYTTEKINIILTDAEKKLKSINGVFALIDDVTNKFSALSDTIFGKIVSLVEKIINKKEE